MVKKIGISWIHVFLNYVHVTCLATGCRFFELLLRIFPKNAALCFQDMRSLKERLPNLILWRPIMPGRLVDSAVLLHCSLSFLSLCDEVAYLCPCRWFRKMGKMGNILMEKMRNVCFWVGLREPPFSDINWPAQVKLLRCMLLFAGTGFCFQKGMLLPHGFDWRIWPCQPEELLGVCCWAPGFLLTLAEMGIEISYRTVTVNSVNVIHGWTELISFSERMVLIDWIISLAFGWLPLDLIHAFVL